MLILLEQRVEVAVHSLKVLLLALVRAAPVAAQSLDTEVVAALEAALDDEYRAEALYAAVLVDFGDAKPFSRIIEAERRHQEALLTLFAAYGLEPPEYRWSIDDVPRYPTIEEACAADVEAELDNAGRYEGFLELDLPGDVRRVFEDNRWASQQNHLRALQSCGSDGCGGSGGGRGGRCN